MMYQIIFFLQYFFLTGAKLHNTIFHHWQSELWCTKLCDHRFMYYLFTFGNCRFILFMLNTDMSSKTFNEWCQQSSLPGLFWYWCVSSADIILKLFAFNLTYTKINEFKNIQITIFTTVILSLLHTYIHFIQFIMRMIFMCCTCVLDKWQEKNKNLHFNEPMWSVCKIKQCCDITSFFMK